MFSNDQKNLRITLIVCIALTALTYFIISRANYFEWNDESAYNLYHTLGNISISFLALSWLAFIYQVFTIDRIQHPKIHSYRFIILGALVLIDLGVIVISSTSLFSKIEEAPVDSTLAVPVMDTTDVYAPYVQ